MFHLLTLGSLACIVAAIARLNNSNKLFWTLIVSMLLGFAGGSIHHHEKSMMMKKEGTTIVSPMQPSTITVPAPDLVSLEAEPILAIEDTRAFVAKAAGLDKVHRDVVVSPMTLQAFNPESDIGIVIPPNTS